MLVFPAWAGLYRGVGEAVHRTMRIPRMGGAASVCGYDYGV